MKLNTEELINKINEAREKIQDNNTILKGIAPKEGVEVSKDGIRPRTLIIAGALVAGVAYKYGRKDGIKYAVDQSVPMAFKAGYEKAIKDVFGKLQS